MRMLAIGAATILVVVAPFVPSQISLARTNLMAANGQLVMLGDSEDAGASHPLARNPTGGMIFFLPASTDHFGGMHLGWLWQGEYRSFQAGMNDQGLAYAYCRA